MHGTPSRRMIRYDPSSSGEYDYLYAEPPVPVQLGGSRNLLEFPNMLFNNLAKEGMGKHLHLAESEILLYWDL